jgi:hypothetical protein
MGYPAQGIPAHIERFIADRALFYIARDACD